MERGNTVKIITKNTGGSCLQIGDIGEVMAVDEVENETWVAVEFDFEFADAHDCDGNCENGWWIPIVDLEIIK